MCSLDKSMKFDQISSQEAINQMVELGYIEKPSGNLAMDIKQTYCDKRFNLSKVYIGKGDLLKAKEILLVKYVAKSRLTTFCYRNSTYYWFQCHYPLITYLSMY